MNREAEISSAFFMELLQPETVVMFDGHATHMSKLHVPHSRCERQYEQYQIDGSVEQEDSRIHKWVVLNAISR